MKIIITLLFLSLGSLSYGHSPKPTPFPILLFKMEYFFFADSSCDIDNYFDEYRYKERRYDKFKCDLSEADLSEADLSDATLNFSDLKDVILTGANLYKLHAIGSKFHRADLTGVDLRESVLSNSLFIRANLSGANFTGAILKDAYFGGADFITEANFTNAKVDPGLGAYLTSQGVSGFIVVENVKKAE